MKVVLIVKILKQEMIDVINNRLSWLESYIKLNNSNNLTDINIYCEDFFLNILNILYGYELINLNKLKENYCGIDLGDKINKVCVQATADNSSSKIKETIKSFDDNNYCKYYNRLIILIEGTKRHYNTNFESKTIIFDKDKDIIDIKKLSNDIFHSDDSKIKKIYDYIYNNLIPNKMFNASLSERDYILEQKKRIYALCLSKLKALHLDENLARSIIDEREYNKELLSQQGVHYLVGEFGSGKSHTLYLLTLDLTDQYLDGTYNNHPIFVQPTDLTKFDNLEQYLISKNLDLNNCTIIFDGLDEMEYTQIDSILSEINFLSNLHENFNAIISSRYFPEIYRNKAIKINPLSIEQINALYCKINNTESFFIESEIKDNKELLETLLRPFFSILFSLVCKKGKYKIKNEMDLIKYFIDLSLESYQTNNPTILDDFAKLAVIFLNENLGSIHKSQLGNTNNIKEYLKSGFVIEIYEDYYTFPLPIIAQWLGAQAIKNNFITIDEILLSVDKVLKWRYSLSILFNDSTYEDSKALFTKIISSYPGIAPQIIRNGISKLPFKVLPKDSVCGERLYYCMDIWLKSLARMNVNLLSDDVHTNTLVISKNENNICCAWANSYLDTKVKTDNILNLNPFIYDIIFNRSVPAQDTWSWFISLDYLSAVIKKIIEKRQLIPNNSKIEQEYLWKCGLILLKNKGNLYSKPISIHEFDMYRVFLKEPNFYINNICINEFFKRLDRYIESNGDYLEPPYPLADYEIQKGFIWECYSKEKMLEWIRCVYLNALYEYKLFVETYFPTVKMQLSTYLKLPGVLKGKVIWNKRRSEPILYWYIIKLPKDQQTRCEINYSETAPLLTDQSIYNSKKNSLQLNCPEDIGFIHDVIYSELCYSDSATPITDLVYRFLNDDLKNIGLIS